MRRLRTEGLKLLAVPPHLASLADHVAALRAGWRPRGAGMLMQAR